MRRLAALAAAVLVALAAAGAARADGDPASDFLYLGTLYPSLSKPAKGANGDELRGLLKVARAKGYPVKVALIVDKQDLGQYPQLFGSPQRYADLLASELAIYKQLKAPVLVVTPNGLGVAGNERLARSGKLVAITHARAKALLAGLPGSADADGESLAKVAIDGVRQLATKDGQALPQSVTPVAAPGAAATPKAKSSVSGWLVAGIVAALFFAAWLVFEVVASLRERKRNAATGSSAPD
jgi:hypothetical protein